MTTQYFKVRNGLIVGEDAVTVDATTGNVVATGDLTVKDTVTIQGATSGSVALAAPAVAGSQAYTLPTALPSVSGYVLASDTGGVMSWVANPDTNTTYTIDASTTTGGANFNLVGSDATTDTVKFANGTNVTVVATDANTLTISSTDTNTTYTQDVNSTTGGANLNLVGSDATTDSVKFAGGTNVTVVATDASTMTINATDTNTTYTIDASSTTGGANLNLVGSDATTDTVKIASGTAITVSQTDANTITVDNAGVTSLTAGTGIGVSGSTGGVTVSNTGVTSAVAGTGISVSGSTGAVTFSNTGVTALAGTNHISVNASTGSITVTSDATNLNTSGTIVARNGNGDFSAGTITANLANGDRVLGGLTATPSTTFVFPSPVLSSINDNNGLDAASSFTGTLGNGAQQQLTQYIGDTFAGVNTTAAIGFRTANGNSEATGTVPFTGLAAVAPSASSSGSVLGTVNYAGYGTTDWANYIASMYQGGGRNANHNLQIQGISTEAYSSGTLTISGATITAVSRVSAALSSVSVSGTKGQISFTASTPAVGQAIVVTGTNSGTSTGISAGTYYITQTTATTNAQLSLTPGGAPITTTAGTTTGLTFTRQFITVTYSAQTYIPFGLNAMVTISGFNNVTSGTYMCNGTSTTTSVNIGAPSSGVPTLSGSQSVSCPTVTNGGSGLRIRAMPANKPMNSGNRVEIINHNPEAAVYRADSFTFNAGGYGATGVGVTGDKIVYNRVYGQWQYDATVTPAAANTAYAFQFQGGSAVTDYANIASATNTSRIQPNALGFYNLQFSIQLSNTDNAADHVAYIWWRKNGTDIPSSMGRVYVTKANQTIAAWNNVVQATATTDYFELMYAVDDVQLVFPYFASTAFGPATAAAFVSLVSVGA